MSSLSALPVFIPGRPYTALADRPRALHLLRVAEFLWDSEHPLPAPGERAAAFARMAEKLLGVAA
jgi:hypothetical protein